MDGVGIVHKTDKCGWFYRDLRSKVELEPAPLVHGRVMTRHRFFQNSIELSRPDPLCILLINVVDEFKDPEDALSC